MLARSRRTALGLVTMAALSLAAAGSPSLRTSIRAAYRAFRDPSLLEPPPPPAPALVSCAGLAGLAEEGRALAPAAAELDPKKSFERPIPADLDDPDGAALKTLTLPDLRVPITRRAMRFVSFLTRTEAGRAAFVQRYRRAGLYRESVAFALREAGLPEDLLWVAAVESGFDPRAVSPAGAAGLWQFMPDTAQIYGLDQSPWVDERRSITRSTHAAVTHLRDLYERFGRWDLALAAYNAGYDRVMSAVDRVARDRGPEHLTDKPIEFADLAAARALPDETINYVPQIMAFALVAANRSRFALDIPELGAPMEIGELAVPAGTRLRVIARAAGVSLSVLRDYNPQILKDRVPPLGGDYLIALPESRVQRALATFPSYSDQEVLAQNDADPEAIDDPTLPLGAVAVDPDADDPLPRRPVPLGKNRLPELDLPGRERVLVRAAAFGVGVLEAKLPASLAMPDIGWRRAYAEDPLGLFGGRARVTLAAKGREQAIDKQLGFLHEAPASIDTLRASSLPNGITVRVRRDKGAPHASITVRIAAVDDVVERSVLRTLRPGADRGSSEVLHTITVDKGDADAGIEIASARLRLALGETSLAPLAEIRFRAGKARREELAGKPYGQAWIALSDALFPAEHPLAGTVIGASREPAALRDLMIVEAMRREHALARASITVVGDIDEARARKLAEAFLAPLRGPMEAPILPHPREDRLAIEEEVPSPRLLAGWIAPGEGEVGDASLRVLAEMIDNPKIGALPHTLDAHALSEAWPRAGVFAIDLAASRDVADALRALDAELARFAGEGPDAVQLATAKFFVHARVQKEIAATNAATNATSSTNASPRGLDVHSASLAQLRRAASPGAAERTLKALDEVSVASVRAAVKRVLARDHRVTVATLPKAR